MRLEVMCRSDIFRMAHFLIQKHLGSRRINGILFALKAEKQIIHLVEIKALNQSNDIFMEPVNYVELTSYLSWAILIGTGSWGVYSVFKYFSIFFKDEVTFTNLRNGKTITLGKHHRKGQAEELLDFFE